MSTESRMTRDEAESLAQKAVSYWVSRGGLGVSYTIFAANEDRGGKDWSFRLTGMCPDRGVPLKWAPGAVRAWLRRRKP